MTDESNIQNGGPDVTEAADEERNAAQSQGSPENDERRPGLGSLAQDAAHPFDQTNGLIDGLEGDADDPDVVEERLREEGAKENPLGIRTDDIGANRSGSGG